MEDGKPDETDTDGKKPNNDSKEDEKELSTSEKIDAEYEKTKASNDKLAAELQRGEELKAKATLGGKSDAGQEEMKTPEEIKEAEASDRVQRIGKAMGAEWANKKEEYKE